MPPFGHGREILETGVLPGPPAGPFEPETAYPLALDRDGDWGAVAFAVLDAYPDIEPGWWTFAVNYILLDGTWHESFESDNCTSATPFARPAAAENSTVGWCDWHSNGSVAGFGAGEPDRHGFFGIAPATTARLTVTDAGGRERDLSITPWCGAYVATVSGTFSRLTGYGPDGATLGSFVCMEDRPDDPEVFMPPLGWKRVEDLGGGGVGGAMVFERREPPDDAA